ncbi:MAG TPA: PLDc N-terminal domain-containing protein [Candidatus Binatia bacterium]|nr:PLDc N-terminal domain-containing protein [Candidatus Binatia bacterium]
MKPTVLLGMLAMVVPFAAAQNAANGLVAWFAGLGVVGVLIGVLALVFWIWMLVDAVVRPFTSDLEKVVWILVIIFLNILGALLYYVAVRLPQGKLTSVRRRTYVR